MSYFAVHVLRVGNIDIQPGVRIRDGLLDKATLERLIQKGAVREFTTQVPAAVESPMNQEVLDPSRWAYDPKTLEGKGIEVLNMMIAEHVKKYGMAPIAPFETEEEAIFWLSKDKE